VDQLKTELMEFTVEIETRPMVSLDPEDLDRLQQAAALESEMLDPVFALDESKGSILGVFQVWAATAVLAAALGAWCMFTTMVRAGFDATKDTIEMISVSKASEENELAGLVQLPTLEESHT
jgi:hypothetical protein